MNKLKIAFRTEKHQSDIPVMDAPITDVELGAVVRVLATARRHAFDRYDNAIAANPSIEQDSGISVTVFEARSDDWMAAEAAINEANRKAQKANSSRYNAQREVTELKKNIDVLNLLAQPGIKQLMHGISVAFGGTSVARDDADPGKSSGIAANTQGSGPVEPTPPEYYGD